jgi:hypothetical protein
MNVPSIPDNNPRANPLAAILRPSVARPNGEIKPVPNDQAASKSPTIQARIDAQKAKGPPDTSTASSLSGPLLTLEGLQQAWGESDSAYDLDADGTVGIGDFLMLLAEGGVMENPDREAAPTIDGVIATWGESNTTYDVDESGTVGIDDFLAVLAQQSATSSAVESEPRVASGEVIHDTDIALQTSKLDPTAPLEAAATEPEDVQEITERSAHTFAEIRDLASSIFDRLRTAGFNQRPPEQLHTLLDRLNVSSSEKRTLLEQLAAKYPNGLGLNKVG